MSGVVSLCVGEQVCGEVTFYIVCQWVIAKCGEQWKRGYVFSSLEVTTGCMGK